MSEFCIFMREDEDVDDSPFFKKYSELVFVVVLLAFEFVFVLVFEDEL